MLVSVWPIFLIAFLVPQQGRLEEEDFKNKFTSMYLDNKTNKYLGEEFVKDRKLCYLYHVPFCVRRLCLVLSFFFFREDQTLTLYAILVIQTAYYTYLIESMPHIEDYFNTLEIINEVSLILIVYIFFGFNSTENAPMVSSEA